MNRLVNYYKKFVLIYNGNIFENQQSGVCSSRIGVREWNKNNFAQDPLEFILKNFLSSKKTKPRIPNVIGSEMLLLLISSELNILDFIRIFFYIQMIQTRQQVQSMPFKFSQSLKQNISHTLILERQIAKSISKQK